VTGMLEFGGRRIEEVYRNKACVWEVLMAQTPSCDLEIFNPIFWEFLSILLNEQEIRNQVGDSNLER